MINEAFEHLNTTTRKYMVGLETQPEFRGVNWTAVESQLVSRTPLTGIDDEEKAAWLAVLAIERSNFLLQFETGRLQAEAFQTLETFIADLDADAPNTDTADLGQLYDKEFGKLCDALREEGKRQEKAYEVAIAYLRAQEEVAHVTKDKAKYAKVVEAHKDNVEKMQFELENFQVREGACASIKQRRALQLVLLNQRSSVEHMQHHGELKDLDAGPIISEINQKIQANYLMNSAFSKTMSTMSSPSMNQVVPTEATEVGKITE